jgi:hypothetical protein
MLYKVIDNIIPKQVLTTKNRNQSWDYGYNEEYNIVIISQDGTLGEIYQINGLLIGLPLAPNKLATKHNKWVVFIYPSELKSIKSMAEWNKRDNAFKNLWIDYIEDEFIRRENGYWFMNNNVPTYITGSHYMFLQWSKIDVGLPNFWEAHRVLYIFWEACKADYRCFGLIYLKTRRTGFSFIESSECVNIGTINSQSKIGILSKTGSDAKEMFTEKVVPIYTNYPFFFKPIQDGMDKPKTELSFKVPASKITKSSINKTDTIHEEEGLNTVIDWSNTDDNAYDGQKLLFLAHDESGKWLRPQNIKNNWNVTRTCLRLGQRIIGKCMMGSTANALDKGGQNYKDLFNASDPMKRTANDRTESGLYSLYIPMEWYYEGFINEYGMPIFEASKKNPVFNSEGEKVSIGVVEYWENEAKALKSDSSALNEFYRQNSRTISHAFRDESKSSLYNLTKIYQQIDYNEGLMEKQYITTGYFSWLDGVKDTKVVWTPDPKGRFKVSWIPPKELQNNVTKHNGRFYPNNEHLGAFGCDSYDISGVVGGGGSKGALHGKTKYNLDDAPVNEFFLEYVSRPSTAEIFFEDVLMACVFYGMPMLAENNKPRLLYHFKHRGYRAFSMNRPDKPTNKLSVTELELGGVPSASEDMKQAHADAIGTYIEKNVGYDLEGTYRSSDEIGNMHFNETLHDWARFDINNRTSHDASISSGYAIMATQKHLYLPIVKTQKISINFAQYDNKGTISKIKNHNE